jgi:hypothetical protein
VRASHLRERHLTTIPNEVPAETPIQIPAIALQRQIATVEDVCHVRIAVVRPVTDAIHLRLARALEVGLVLGEDAAAWSASKVF